MAPYELLCVELDGAELVAVPPGRWDGCRAILRRDAVPVGAAFIDGRRPGTVDELVARAQLREAPLPGGPNETVTITVAVCTKDRPERLSTSLASIQVAIEAAGDEVAADVLVIDNASALDATREVALAAGARCEREPVPGLDVARNRAVAAATSDVVAFVDDDVVVDRLWLRTLARSFADHPEAGAVVGGVRALRLDTPARVAFERCGGFTPSWQLTVITNGDAADLPFRTGIGAGCNMAFRRSALDRAGPFDEALDTGRPMPGGGDVDMIIRMIMLGTIVYEPSAMVFHDHRASWRELRYQYYSWGKGWAAVLAKWHAPRDVHAGRIRRVACHTLMSYARRFIVGRRRAYGYRRAHAALLAMGFVAGACGSYGRSRRRMQQRRRDASAAAAPIEPPLASGTTC